VAEKDNFVCTIKTLAKLVGVIVYIYRLLTGLLVNCLGMKSAKKKPLTKKERKEKKKRKEKQAK